MGLSKPVKRQLIWWLLRINEPDKIMQDISKKFKFFKLRKRLWRSKPYRFYLYVYGGFLNWLIHFNSNRTAIIFINGMRRSGNHYLMKTLMDSSSASVIFYNNQDVCANLDVRNGLQTKYRFSKNILLIVGYEDLPLKDFENSIQFISNGCLKEADVLKLIVIRDLRNIMASRLNHAHMAKQLKTKLDVLEQTKLLWKEHHNAYENSNLQVIRYNNLISDLHMLNLNSFFITELKESKNVLNRYGGGSSFESNHFNSRYLKFEDDLTYQSLINGLEQQDQLIHGLWQKN